MRGLNDIDFQGIAGDDDLLSWISNAARKINPLNIYQPNPVVAPIDSTPSPFHQMSEMPSKTNNLIMEKPDASGFKAFKEMLNPQPPTESSPTSQRQSAITSFLTKIDEFISLPSQPVSSQPTSSQPQQARVSPPNQAPQKPNSSPQGQQKGPPKPRVSQPGLCDGNNLYICLLVGAVVIGGLFYYAAKD